MHHPVGRTLARAAALDAPGETLARWSRRLSESRALGPFLDGRGWLGNPAHPAFVDLPIGFWTSSWCLDFLPRNESFAQASDALVALGIASAMPAVASGLADHRTTSGETRRVATGHAALNAGAVACYTVSLAMRLAGRRRAGLAWSWAGAALATLGGGLGGELVFERGTRVRRG